MLKRLFYYTGVIVFGLLTALAVAATLLPLIPSKEWYIQIFDYPRLQTFFVALLALVWYGLAYFKRNRRSYFLLLLFFAVMMVQAYKAFPFTPLGANQVQWADKENGRRTISLFICNVLQTNTQYAAVLEKIGTYKPDIVITTETDTVWERALSVLEPEFRYRVAVPQSNTYGMHLYSRLPLAGGVVRYLVEPDIPSIRSRVQLSSGEWIQLYVVHPRPPVPTEASDSRERDAEIILVGRESKTHREGVIVAGDFNDVAWSENTELFQEVSGLLDPRRGRGFYNTFHAKIPVFRWPLDHVFHSSHFTLVSMERVGPVNSDHFPVFIKLQYEPQDKAEQPAVKPDSETEKKAKQTIREGKTDGDKK